MIFLTAFSVMLMIAMPMPASAAMPLPDTGQTKCYNNSQEIPCPDPGAAFYGQDGQYQGAVRSYSKLAANDVVLVDSAAPANGWLMTRDNVTGLIWEIKTTDGSIHDKGKRYTWCDPDSTTNGGNQGTCGNGTDTNDFISTLNNASFGGHADWRLPTIMELSTLVDSSIPYPGPTIDSIYFPHGVLSNYWSSTTSVNNQFNAWYVSFYYGLVNYNYKSSSDYVRAGQ